MEIGVIGMNDYAKAFCKHWIKRGHKILFADLHLYSGGYALAEELGSNVSLTLPEKVARQAEIIVLAVPSKHLLTAIEGLDGLKQKIVVDLIIEDQESRAIYPKSSYEEIQQHLPEAKVVKVTPDFPNHLYQLDAEKNTLYSYSNDQLAQRMVRWFLDGSGYNMIDLQNNSVKQRK